MGRPCMVVRQLAIAIACTACNAVFGIGDVALVDAAYFDAPPRTFACPPTGAGLPSFGEAVHEVVTPECHAYTIASDGTAMALCGLTNAVWVAEPDASLAPLAIPLPYLSVFDARLSGDGKLAVIQVATSSGEVAFAMHHDRTTHRWTMSSGTLPFTNGTVATLSSGPPFHLIYFVPDADVGLLLAEVSGDGDTWTSLGSYPVGVVSVTTAGLTPDGLHLVAQIDMYGSIIMYSDRATLGQPFTTFRTLDTVPVPIVDPYLTTDCARLYFTALGRVLYLEQ